MARERSEKCRFVSAYGGGYLAAGQFLAETVCARMARHQGTELPQHFWETNGTWKRTFLFQLRQAHSLLKDYSIEAVILALRSPEGQKVYSLTAPWLDALIQTEQAKLDHIRATPGKQESNPVVAPEPLRPTFPGPTSPRSKLKDL